MGENSPEGEQDLLVFLRARKTMEF